MNAQDVLCPTDTFVHRHLGPNDQEIAEMLKALGLDSLDALANEAVPDAIRMQGSLSVGEPRGEHEMLAELAQTFAKNEVRRSLIGMGYYDCITPAVILRNVLENPGWYTAYTPYQAEIAQGRMEALVNFQTMVSDLTGLPLANASLLDEGTAAAEAMSMCHAIGRGKKNGFFVAEDCHPQTIEVVRTRAKPVGFDLTVGKVADIDFGDLFGLLLQYPNTDGEIADYAALVEKAHASGCMVVVATDLLALTLLTPPGEWGADIAVGSSQRLGVPMGAGGPHAAFMSTQAKHQRHLPGRIIGVSKDARGKPGYRLSLQTREQHIRRDRATSNICTAQVLLAVMAGMYGVYHGPEGLRAIARRVRGLTAILRTGLGKLGFDMGGAASFDTLRIRLSESQQSEVLARANDAGINLRCHDNGDLGLSLDETCDASLVDVLFEVFSGRAPDFSAESLLKDVNPAFGDSFDRSSDFMSHEVFHRYRSETEMMRYLHRLEVKDLALNTSMIPLGSCTMKLNAASEMIPVTWEKAGRMHPFAPRAQSQGYQAMYEQLERWLENITGFAAVSLQPNAGSQGEYSGLLVIRAWHEDRGQGHRNVCLIPTSAHGTNPASAVMAGMKVVPIKCNDRGDIDLVDLKAKAAHHADNLSCIMVTYPSTHGVFEAGIQEICDTIHEHGGQVYLDGANMNAQVGLCRPGDYGADVCHLNLHKTFCIPHGGGGPGIGPIGVAAHLAPFLPGHPEIEVGDKQIGPISAAPYGSASILSISYMYIGLMGSAGLKKATQVAILSANYMASRLEGHYEIVYRGDHERVAHEFILDMRGFKKSAGIEVDDIAKRLMDFGFHAPTMSWPVAGTMMVEPTESESKAELDRFCDALISIRQEIRAIEEGKMDRSLNPLKNAPHTADVVCGTEWPFAYSREQAAFPAPELRAAKYWPPVARIDNAYGDRNLVCTCPPMEDYVQ